MKCNLKTIHHTILIICIIFFLYSHVFAECKIADEINRFKTKPDNLSIWIKSQTFNSICYLPIGKIYLNASKKEINTFKKEQYLQNAKTYLEFAVSNMSRSDHTHYLACYRLLIQAECLSDIPDLKKLLAYVKCVPLLKPVKDIQINKHLMNQINEQINAFQADSSVINDPLNFIRLIDILGITTNETHQLKARYQKSTPKNQHKSTVMAKVQNEIKDERATSLKVIQPKIKKSIQRPKKQRPIQRPKQIPKRPSQNYLTHNNQIPKQEKKTYNLDELKNNELLLSVEANALTPNIKKIYSSINIPGLRISQVDIDAIVKAIENNHLLPYITNFTAQDNIPLYVFKVYQKFTTKQTYLQAYRRTQHIKQNYKDIQQRLQNNTTNNKIDDIQRMINLLKTNKQMRGIQPYLEAYSSWLLSINLLQEIPENAYEQCRLYKRVIKFLNVASRKIPFIDIPKNLNCTKDLACLVNKFQIETVFPEYKDTAQHLIEKQERCILWIESYYYLSRRCQPYSIIEDYRPFLFELLDLFDALEHFHASISSLNPLRTLHDKTRYDMVKKFTGSCLAKHYYKVVLRELKAGPMNNNELGTLKNIGTTLNLYHLYSNNRNQQEIINITEQHQLLSFFFLNISSNYYVAKKSMKLIDNSLKKAWKVQETFDKYKYYWNSKGY